MNDILTPKDWKSRTFASEFETRVLTLLKEKANETNI